MIHIETVDNGWILTESVDDPEADDIVEVFEQSDDGDLSHAQAVQRMLYAILENLGEYGSKHDPYRVRVNIETNGDFQAPDDHTF